MTACDQSSRSALWRGLTDWDQHRDSHFWPIGVVMAKFEDSREEPVISAVREQPLPTQVKLLDQDNRVVLTDIDIPFSRAVIINYGQVDISRYSRSDSRNNYYIRDYLLSRLDSWPVFRD